MNKVLIVGCSVLIISTALLFAQQKKPDINGYHPKDGFVPDEKTACSIAEAIWLPIYGKDVLANKPFKAKLYDNNIWVVEGSPKKILFIQVAGGTPYAEIDKDTGMIIKVTHSK